MIQNYIIQSYKILIKKIEELCLISEKMYITNAQDRRAKYLLSWKSKGRPRISQVTIKKDNVSIRFVYSVNCKAQRVATSAPNDMNAVE